MSKRFQNTAHDWLQVAGKYIVWSKSSSNIFMSLVWDERTMWIKREWENDWVRRFGVAERECESRCRIYSRFKKQIKFSCYKNVMVCFSTKFSSILVNVFHIIFHTIEIEIFLLCLHKSILLFQIQSDLNWSIH
jgi:hypothetical protein